MKKLYLLVSILLVFAIVPASAETGIITGMVTSANNAAVPDATVTLTDIENGSTIDGVPNNPQLTSNFSGSLPGTYTFTDVPYGTYNLTAEKDGKSYFTTIQVQAGTATANIVIPEEISPDTSTVTPQPSVEKYTYVPIKIASAPAQSAVSQSPGFGLLMAFLALATGIVIIKARKP